MLIYIRHWCFMGLKYPEGRYVLCVTVHFSSHIIYLHAISNLWFHYLGLYTMFSCAPQYSLLNTHLDFETYLSPDFTSFLTCRKVHPISCLWNPTSFWIFSVIISLSAWAVRSKFWMAQNIVILEISGGPMPSPMLKQFGSLQASVALFSIWFSLYVFSFGCVCSEGSSSGRTLACSCDLDPHSYNL